MKIISIHSLAVIWTSKLNRYANKEGIELQKMIYGMELLLHNVPKLILIIAVAAMVGILPHTIITILSFASIRAYAGGLHASNSINCTIVSLFKFIAIPFVLQDTQLINVESLIFIFTVIGLGLYKYAPADTEAGPILGKERRARLKRKSVLASIIVLTVTLIFVDNIFYGLVAIGALYAIISILPISYRILGRSMNNYEKYE